MVWTTLALLTAAASPVAAAQDEIDRYRWTSRLVVTVAPRGDDPRLKEQRGIFERAPAEIRERDLVLIQDGGRSDRAAALRRRFGIAPGEFRAILVGKDGGAKLSQSRPIALDRLFDEIDRMPMRRDEMRAYGRRAAP